MSPASQVAVVRPGEARDVAGQLLVDVDQAGGRRHSGLDRETQTVGLARAMVGVLADDDDLHVVQFTSIQGREGVFRRRVDRLRLAFSCDKLGQLKQVRFRGLAIERVAPARVLQGFQEVPVNSINLFFILHVFI